MTEPTLRELEAQGLIPPAPTASLRIEFDFVDLAEIPPEGKSISLLVNGVWFDGEAKLQANMITMRAEHGVIVLRTNRKQLAALELEQRRRLNGQTDRETQ